MRSDWDFDTIRTSSIMGTMRSMHREIDVPAGMSFEEDIFESDEESHHHPSSIDTSAATRGSDPLITSHADAGHSTMVIKPLAGEVAEKDISALLAEEGSGSANDPSSGGEDIPPPAYTGSMRSERRSSRNARHSLSGQGTVMRAADLGNGVDTIRPVKKVDAAGSLRLSNDFVGSLRKEGSASTPPSSPPTSTHRRMASEQGRAGRDMVNEIVLPILQKVASSSNMHRTGVSLPVLQNIRDDMDARELEALSMLTRGFTELKDANPELSYKLILDILSGIHECVVSWLSFADCRCSYNTTQQSVGGSACPDDSIVVPSQTHHS